MSIDYNKAPFPWPGGKSKAADLVWRLLGDPAHYVEPFAGSLAVLLNRPHQANRTYFSETVNDADGLLVNAWRSIQLEPDAVAEAASNPVAEADLHARHVALIRWREEHQLEHLMGDPLFCDPLMGGWWLWGVCCWIGGEWCHGSNGPWWPDDNDRLTKWAKGDPERPTLNDTGPGVSRKLPHLGDNGKGVNRPQLRDPGVFRALPHLGNNGMGVNRPRLREPGVSRGLPHLSTNGMGVNHAGLREPGVFRARPHLGNNGMGVNRPQLREPGVEVDTEYHPVVMPELRRWMAYLSARLRHVRIANGDWTRVCGTGAVQSLPVRQGNGHAGIFLDPPYGAAAGRASVYGHTEDFMVADDVREWCLEWGDRPDYRIVLAGFDVEHTELEDHGWSVHEWFKAGYLTGGYGNLKQNGTHQQHRERLWASPACTDNMDGQVSLFDVMSQ